MFPWVVPFGIFTSCGLVLIALRLWRRLPRIKLIQRMRWFTTLILLMSSNVVVAGFMPISVLWKYTLWTIAIAPMFVWGTTFALGLLFPDVWGLSQKN